MRATTGQDVGAAGFDQALVSRLLKYIGNPNVSVRLWNGDEFRISEGRPVACIEILDRGAIFELIRSPSIGFGE